MWVVVLILQILLWIVVGIAALILLVLPLRISVAVRYDQKGFLVRAGFGPVRMTVFPQVKDKEKKPKKRDKPKKEKAPREMGGTVDMLKRGLSILGPILSRLKRRLVISELRLHYTISTNDAATTALAYGGAHIVVGQILSLLQYHFRVKKQDAQIDAGFDAAEDRALLRVKLSISVWGALCLGLFALKEARRVGLIMRKDPIKEGVIQHEQASG